MKQSLYSRLALTNLKKNSRFYIPHILTGVGLQGSFYIILTLALDQRLREVRGGDYIPTFMAFGAIIMIILSTILMLYTNSFLMKQRKREFGLYNVLGMEKRHVGRILFFEMLYSGTISIVAGLAFGMIFYKLCSLLICRLLGVESILGFYYLASGSTFFAAGFFVLLYILLYLIDIITIKRMKPIELIQSCHTGEKEPRVKWLLLIPGLAATGYGYYLALTVKNPLQAVNIFFIAILLVIAGTYLLFIAGTIAVLKLLKRNKAYYYHPKHMVPVSGLLYRMKQNAVGLASITILSCGVLVMISTTISLYAGIEDMVKRNYPNDLYFAPRYTLMSDEDELIYVPLEETEEWVRNVASENGVGIESVQYEQYLECAFGLNNDVFETDISKEATVMYSFFITQDQYEQYTGNEIDLGEHDLAVCRFKNTTKAPFEDLTIGEKTYHMKTLLSYYPIKSSGGGAYEEIGIVLPSQADVDYVYQIQKEAYKDNASEYTSRIAVSFDQEISNETGEKITDGLWQAFYLYCEGLGEDIYSTNIRLETIWETREYAYGLNGSFLFLGLILGFVFLFATVLIIYYKQISEGYEDRERFQILKKIGLSDAETKKTINQQILLVFFLPILVSAVHIAAAFPMLEKLLHLLLLSSTMLFLKCTILIFLIFTVVYILIYTLTAKVYYKIIH